MRRIFFLLFAIIQNSCISYAREVVDSGLIEKTGWLVYWHDKIIWVESEIDNNIDDAIFFKGPTLYPNGVNLIGSNNAVVYKSIAKSYSISYYHNDSVVIETDPEFLDSIRILPVRVKYKTGYDAASETMTVSFIKNKREIFIKYKGLADYDIKEITLLRKCDKRKIKRVKSNEVYPPY